MLLMLNTKNPMNPAITETVRADSDIKNEIK